MTLSGKPATQQEVAREAGVSRATVSHILSGRPSRSGNSASPETRERVLEAARRLGYQRNHAARSLRRRKTEVVAVIHPSPDSPWITRLVDQLHDAARQVGYSVITMPVGGADRIDAALRILREQHVDGAILTPQHGIPIGELTTLAHNGLALVVYDDDETPAGFDVVRNSQYAACRQAMEHLIERGHRRIAYFALSDAAHQPFHDAKYAAFHDTMSALHGDVDSSLILPAANSRSDAFRATQELLGRDAPPTAIFSASDRAALAAIWAAQQSGIRVPDQLAVIGVGNTDESAIITPSLTTVGSAGFDFTAMVDRLFARISASGPVAAQEIHQTWELLIRQSS